VTKVSIGGTNKNT